jgi:hypothetical protein
VDMEMLLPLLLNVPTSLPPHLTPREAQGWLQMLHLVSSLGWFLHASLDSAISTQWQTQMRALPNPTLDSGLDGVQGDNGRNELQVYWFKREQNWVTICGRYEWVREWRWCCYQ